MVEQNIYIRKYYRSSRKAIPDDDKTIYNVKEK